MFVSQLNHQHQSLAKGFSKRFGSKQILIAHAIPLFISSSNAESPDGVSQPLVQIVWCNR